MVDEVAEAVTSADPLRLFNRLPNIATVIAIMVIGPAVFLILPAFVGALAETYGFTEAQLGILASADLTGMALGAITALYWRARWNWRLVAGLALAGIVVGNLLTTGVSDFGPLVALRFAVGSCGGLAVAVCVAFISYTRDPDRVAAFLFICQVSFMTVSFAIAPTIVGAWGVNGIFVGLAILTALVISFLRLVPMGPPAEGDVAQVDHSSRRYLPGLAVLLSMTLFFIGVASIWAFVELMAEAAGLTVAQVATALSISTVIGISGPIVGAIFGDRFGRFLPLAAGFVCQIVVLVLLGIGGYTTVTFLVYLAVFQTFWNLALGYQFGVMVQQDTTKRLIVLVPTFQAAGIALGPTLAGVGIEAVGFTAVPIISGIALALYALLILPFARRPTESDAAEA